MAKTNNKVVSRHKRIKRIRKKVAGSSERPRLRVFKSSKHIYAQLIDDSLGTTLVSASTLSSEIAGQEFSGKLTIAGKVGMLIAEKAKAQGLQSVVFDRGGNLYHGRVKALSEGAREGGLVF